MGRTLAGLDHPPIGYEALRAFDRSPLERENLFYCFI
jgi:hypothetical protein